MGLIIFDLQGTILDYDVSLTQRNNFSFYVRPNIIPGLLELQRGHQVVLASAASDELLESAVQFIADLGFNFDGVYGQQNVYPEGFRRAKVLFKDFSKVYSDFGIKHSQIESDVLVVGDLNQRSDNYVHEGLALLRKPATLDLPWSSELYPEYDMKKLWMAADNPLPYKGKTPGVVLLDSLGMTGFSQVIPGNILLEVINDLAGNGKGFKNAIAAYYNEGTKKVETDALRLYFGSNPIALWRRTSELAREYGTPAFNQLNSGFSHFYLVLNPNSFNSAPCKEYHTEFRMPLAF